jgi:hypothetical protein
MNFKTAAILFILGILASCSSTNTTNMRDVYEEFQNPSEAYPKR